MISVTIFSSSYNLQKCVCQTETWAFWCRRRFSFVPSAHQEHQIWKRQTNIHVNWCMWVYMCLCDFYNSMCVHSKEIKSKYEISNILLDDFLMLRFRLFILQQKTSLIQYFCCSCCCFRCYWCCSHSRCHRLDRKNTLNSNSSSSGCLTTNENIYIPRIHGIPHCFSK